jgi:GNAT superfamily N-acetyltransferase
MPNFQLTKRPLTSQEIDLVINSIKQTPNITGYTKKEWQNFGKVFVAEVDCELAGVVVNVSISKEWEELAVLLVLEEFRGQGIGKALFNVALEDIKSRQKNAYTTSRNPIVLKLMKENGFKFCSLVKLPIDVTLFNLKFIFSLYRLQEFVRKQKAFPKQEAFKYATLQVSLKEEVNK